MEGCGRGGCYHDKEGRASLLFIVFLVLHSLVLSFVKGGLVPIVRGRSRRKGGGRKGTLAAG